MIQGNSGVALSKEKPRNKSQKKQHVAGWLMPVFTAGQAGECAPNIKSTRISTTSVKCCVSMRGANNVINVLITAPQTRLAKTISPLLWHKGGFGQLRAENDFSNSANVSWVTSLAFAQQLDNNIAAEGSRRRQWQWRFKHQSTHTTELYANQAQNHPFRYRTRAFVSWLAS